MAAQGGKWTTIGVGLLVLIGVVGLGIYMLSTKSSKTGMFAPYTPAVPTQNVMAYNPSQESFNPTAQDICRYKFRLAQAIDRVKGTNSPPNISDATWAACNADSSWPTGS